MEPNNERKTPAGEQNELFKKQVFSDETLRTADSDEEETGEQHFETLTFDKPAVLDERFAARKAERETAQPPQAKPAASRPAAKPVKRQVPAAQKNKSVSHERRLYSGETPSDAALRITRQIAALVLCLLLVCGGFWAKGAVWDIWTDRDIEDVQKSTYYSAAANSAQLRLDQNLPIGYDAAQAVCVSLGQPISSSAIPAKADDKDTLIFPADLTGSMETALGSQKLRLETGLTNTDLFKEIYKSLKKKKPVIALMLVVDAESAKLQYGVVTGLDVSNNRVTVALSEGVDTYTLAEFVAATRFENTKNIPTSLAFSLLFGYTFPQYGDLFKMSGLKITLPAPCAFILSRLHENGFEAYAVGGCVRDSLLHKTPHDWDITTAAKPGKNHRAFFRHSRFRDRP